MEIYKRRVWTSVSFAYANRSSSHVNGISTVVNRLATDVNSTIAAWERTFDDVDKQTSRYDTRNVASDIGQWRSMYEFCSGERIPQTSCQAKRERGNTWDSRENIRWKMIREREWENTCDWREKSKMCFANANRSSNHVKGLPPTWMVRSPTWIELLTTLMGFLSRIELPPTWMDYSLTWTGHSRLHWHGQDIGLPTAWIELLPPRRRSDFHRREWIIHRHGKAIKDMVRTSTDVDRTLTTWIHRGLNFRHE